MKKLNKSDVLLLSVTMCLVVTGWTVWNGSPLRGESRTAAFATPQQRRGPASDEDAKRSAPPQVQTKTLPDQAVTKTVQATAQVRLRRPSNLTSIEDMTHTLSEFIRPETQIKDLVEYLRQSKQEPVVAHNSNSETGEMAIVRTKSPPADTRYFHAQYFTDGNRRSFVQHMSFEFKASSHAFDDAMKAVQEAFLVSARPDLLKTDFAKWKLGSGYIVWVKKMALADLQDDPFNAYSESDVGTVRVAVEIDIHGENDGGHGDH